MNNQPFLNKVQHEHLGKKTYILRSALSVSTVCFIGMLAVSLLFYHPIQAYSFATYRQLYFMVLIIGFLTGLVRGIILWPRIKGTDS